MSHIDVDNANDAQVATLGSGLSSEAITRASNDNNILGVYRTLVQRSGYTLDTQSGATLRILPIGGGSVIGSNTTGAMINCFYINPTELAVSGKTTKLNLQAMIGTNNTSLGTTTVTSALYAATMGSVADQVQISIGSVVSGSSVAFVNPGTNTITASTSGDFDIPSAGMYCLTSHQTVQIATDSAFGIVSTVRYRHV